MIDYTENVAPGQNTGKKTATGIQPMAAWHKQKLGPIPPKKKSREYIH